MQNLVGKFVTRLPWYIAAVLAVIIIYQHLAYSVSIRQAVNDALASSNAARELHQARPEVGIQQATQVDQSTIDKEFARRAPKALRKLAKKNDWTPTAVSSLSFEPPTAADCEQIESVDVDVTVLETKDRKALNISTLANVRLRDGSTIQLKPRSGGETIYTKPGEVRPWYDAIALDAEAEVYTDKSTRIGLAITGAAGVEERHWKAQAFVTADTDRPVIGGIRAGVHW